MTGKLLDKGQQHGVDFVRADAPAEPVKGGGHQLGVKLLAIAGHEHMAGLVDKAHGVERAGMDGESGIDVRLADLVHAVGERAAGVQIGEDDISGVGEEGFGKLVALAHASRNMKFHPWTPHR